MAGPSDSLGSPWPLATPWNTPLIRPLIHASCGDHENKCPVSINQEVWNEFSSLGPPSLGPPSLGSTSRWIQIIWLSVFIHTTWSNLHIGYPYEGSSMPLWLRIFVRRFCVFHLPRPKIVKNTIFSVFNPETLEGYHEPNSKIYGLTMNLYKLKLAWDNNSRRKKKDKKEKSIRSLGRYSCMQMK